MDNRITGNHMTLKHFHDFYYLEALMAGMSMAKSANSALQFKHSFERLENDVKAAFDHLTETMARRIFVYIWAACLGEARHAGSLVPMYFNELSPNASRTDVYKRTAGFEPTQEQIALMRKLYEQKEWGNTFGGKKWLSIADALAMYGEVSNATFIDHAVDLEHNGGNIFTKNAMAVGMDVFFDGYNASELRGFLDFKFGHDILNSWKTVEVSFKVKSLVNRYSHIVGKVTTNLDATIEWLTDYSVSWGTDALTTSTKEYNEDDENRRYDDTCQYCGTGIHSENHEHWNQDCICRQCYNRKLDHSVRCAYCGTLVHEDDASYDDSKNKTFCNNCAKHVITCEDCEHDYHNDNMRYSEDGHDLCEECYIEHKCETCGECHFEDMDEHDEQEHSEEAVLARKQHEAQKREGVKQLELPLYNPIGQDTYKIHYAWTIDGSVHIHTEHSRREAQKQMEIFELAGATYLHMTQD
jgi:hypothetical protein